MPGKGKRRTKTEIEAIKRDFKEKCCFKESPIPTEEVFKSLRFEYSNIYDRAFIYRWVSTWTEETLSKIWNFEIEEGNKEKIYRDFLEKCWLEKEPFGYFESGYFHTPRTFIEYEALLNKYTIRAMLGLTTSVQKMADKSMLINSKVPAKEILETVGNIVKLLEISEKDLLDYSEEDLEE